MTVEGGVGKSVVTSYQFLNAIVTIYCMPILCIWDQNMEYVDSQCITFSPKRNDIGGKLKKFRKAA